ncbi:MAG: hypothetical protein NXH75_10255 [Halobacteriovoraceae bacterium]|nr:hypothetical protein [Halobacteriovoraceae bacterium]
MLFLLICLSLISFPTSALNQVSEIVSSDFGGTYHDPSGVGANFGFHGESFPLMGDPNDINQELEAYRLKCNAMRRVEEDDVAMDPRYDNYDGSPGDNFNDVCAERASFDESSSSTTTDSVASEDVDPDDPCDYLNMLKKNFPKKAGYAFPFKDQYVAPLCQQVKHVSEGNYPGPHVSNCATSTFMAIQIKLQLHYKEKFDEMKRDYSCEGSSGFGAGYRAFVIDGIIPWARDHLKKFDPTANVDDFLKTLSPDPSNTEWPKPGDPMVMDRHNGSGHAVVFTRYTNDGSKICYFSSNKGTQGFGGEPDEERCESRSSIKNLTIVKIPLKESENS